MDKPFGLEDYLRRIDYVASGQPTLSELHGLHLAHSCRIPFENIDPLLGRPVRLDLDSLQAKLIHARRGGYCFEQNTLFAAALEALGFEVTRLAARVRMGATRLLARTHMLLKVDVDGASWIADVGFGADGLLQPVPLVSDQPVVQSHWSYRAIEEGGLWVLQSLRDAAWQDLYAFTTEPQFAVDFEMANHFTATYPESVFVRMLTAQLPTPEARHCLRNRQYQIQQGDLSSQQILGDDELHEVLVRRLGLELSPETVTALLRCLPPAV
jgi:N-hydroxyarylamine O-acetyltransferase